VLDGFRLARVEAGLEVAADALAAREHGLVARASRRKLHDPDILVAVAMAARVGGGLIEGPKAVALPLSPHVPRTLIRCPPEAKPASAGCIRTLRQSSRSGGSPAAAPRTPVPSGADEVAMGGDGLRVRAWTVAEQAPLVRAHLEEAEVLAVLRCRLEVRLAPRDGDRSLAVVLEHLADCRSRRERGDPARVASTNLHAKCRDGSRQRRNAPLGVRQSRLRRLLVLRRAQERAVRPEEPHGALIAVERSQRPLQLLLESEARFRRGNRLRRRARLAGRGLRRCRSGLRHENERKQANE